MATRSTSRWDYFRVYGGCSGVLLVANPSTTSRRSRPLCAGWIRVPRLVRSIQLRILALGRILATIRYPCRTHWGILWTTCHCLERSMVGRGDYRPPGRHSRIASIPSRTREARSRRSVVCNRWCHLSRPRLVHQCILDQHLPRIVW